MSVAYLINGPVDSEWTLILAHGAGAPMDSPFMAYMAETVGNHGIRVVRFEFPYMQLRRTKGKKRPPDKSPVLSETWSQIIMRFRTKGKLVIGGKSMGGRIASMIADKEDVAGLICLGYPFHPPGKPEKLRVDHLLSLEVPTMILQGTRDTFGGETEVPGYGLPANIELCWLPDGDHSFKPRVRTGYTEAENLALAASKIVSFMKRP